MRRTPNTQGKHITRIPDLQERCPAAKPARFIKYTFFLKGLQYSKRRGRSSPLPMEGTAPCARAHRTDRRTRRDIFLSSLGFPDIIDSGVGSPPTRKRDGCRHCLITASLRPGDRKTSISSNPWRTAAHFPVVLFRLLKRANGRSLLLRCNASAAPIRRSHVGSAVLNRNKAGKRL